MWCQLTVEFFSVEMTRFERTVLVRLVGRGCESRMSVSPVRFGILSLLLDRCVSVEIDLDVH